MLNKIISISKIDFNTLEKEIFEFGCECARNLMVEILMKIDDQLTKQRNRELYRHKGKGRTIIKTLMGEVEFDRVVYKTQGEK